MPTLVGEDGYEPESMQGMPDCHMASLAWNRSSNPGGERPAIGGESQGRNCGADIGERQ